MTIYPSKLSVFILGFAIGVIIAFVTIVSQNEYSNRVRKFQSLNIGLGQEDRYYNVWLSKMGYTKDPVNFDYYSYSGNNSLIKLLEFQILKARVNILCVMFVKDINNAYAALNTWLKHCNSYKFYGLKPDKYLEVTVMRPKNSWHYLCDVIRHIDSYFNDYMWVLFVPDDTYAIPENLRHYVFGKDFNDNYYIGLEAVFWNVHYNLGQAGYVLSRGSLKVLLKKFNSSESCRQSGRYWKNEDYYLGKHLSELDIVPVDTRDLFGRGRFHAFTPAQLFAPGSHNIFTKYWKLSLHSVVQGVNCCSPQTITFQGTDGVRIYFYHYLLYRLNLHKQAGKLGNAKSNSYTVNDEIWKKFIKDELGPSVNISSITAEKYFQLWSDKIESPSIFNKKLKDLFLNKS